MKTYIKPELSVINVSIQNQILAGSINIVNETTDGVGFSQYGRRRNNLILDDEDDDLDW